MKDAPYQCYLITNQLNQKCYVGYTRQGLKKRFRQHLSSARTGSDYPLHRAIRKHGEEAFVIKGLSYHSRLDLACKQERKLIKQYNTFGSGYNCSPGGERSASKRKGLSVENRQQISKRVKKEWQNPEARAAKVAGVTASWTKERKMSRTENQRGHLNVMFRKTPWNKGKKVPRTYLPSAKDYIITLPSGEELPVHSLKTWANENGHVYRCLQYVLTGKINHHHGLKVRYA